MASGGNQGLAYVSVKINGTAVGEGSNVIKQITFIEGTYTFPQVLFDFYDMHHMFEGNLAIVDGTQIEFTVGASSQNLDTLVFRVAGSRRYMENGAPAIHAAAVIDKNSFMLNTEAYSKRGNAIDILKDLCKKNDVKFVSTETSDDNMTWISLNQSPRMFAERIERCMWLGENKLPHQYFGLDGALHLVDLIKVMSAEPVATFNYNSPTETNTDISVLTLREKSVAGILNYNQNYGRVTLAPNSQTGDLDKIHTADMKTDKSVNISADIKSSLAVTSISHEYADPISQGAGANVHKNWYKAIDQWKRLASTFTEMVRILVRGKDDIPVFSTVQLNAGFLNGSKFDVNAKISGKWIVTAKTIKISSSGYYVAYLLTRNFVGLKGNTALISDSQGANRAMTVEPTVANPNRPTQFNLKVAGSLDSVIAAQNAAMDKMFAGFKSGADQYGFSELKAKYGEDYDSLNALMSEFNMAALVNSMCNPLSGLEKMSLDFSMGNGTGILKNLSSRMDACDSMLASFASDINRLVSDGNIPSSYVSPPTLNAPCNLNSVSDMNRALDNAYPDKCMDAFSLDSLHAPSLNLSQYLRQLEEWFRKFLCAFGDGTVDGSADTKTTQVGIQADYR
jgi:hypothetical protein